MLFLQLISWFPREDTVSSLRQNCCSSISHWEWLFSFKWNMIVQRICIFHITESYIYYKAMKCFRVFQTRQAKKCYKECQIAGMDQWQSNIHKNKYIKKKKEQKKRREIKQSKQLLLRLTEQGILGQHK